LGFRYLLHDFYWSASRALGPARIQFSLEGARVGRVFLPNRAAAGPGIVLPSALGLFLPFSYSSFGFSLVVGRFVAAVFSSSRS
jgi:hypothetical protein